VLPDPLPNLPLVRADRGAGEDGEEVVEREGIGGGAMKRFLAGLFGIAWMVGEWLLVYYGAFGGHVGLGNILIAWAFVAVPLAIVALVLSFAGAAMAAEKEDTRKVLSRKPFAPGWVYFCSDMGIVVSIFYAGWFWTGFAFLSASLMAGTARLVMKEGRKSLTPKEPAP